MTDDVTPGSPGGRPAPADLETGLLRARAAVIHDLAATGLDSPGAVDVVDDAVAARRWWVTQWPEGVEMVAGQVAQDVQDRLLDENGVRWPLCRVADCDGDPFHSLALSPALGTDPHWVCEESGTDVAPLGGLPRQPAGPPELTGGG